MGTVIWLNSESQMGIRQPASTRKRAREEVLVSHFK